MKNIYSCFQSFGNSVSAFIYLFVCLFNHSSPHLWSLKKVSAVWWALKNNNKIYIFIYLIFFLSCTDSASGLQVMPVRLWKKRRRKKKAIPSVLDWKSWVAEAAVYFMCTCPWFSSSEGVWGPADGYRKFDQNTYVSSKRNQLGQRLLWSQYQAWWGFSSHKPSTKGHFKHGLLKREILIILWKGKPGKKKLCWLVLKICKLYIFGGLLQ